MARDTLTRILLAMPDREAKGKLRTITVRLLPELHDALRNEAHERHTSVNKLAVAKLSVKSELLDRLDED